MNNDVPFIMCREIKINVRNMTFMRSYKNKCVVRGQYIMIPEKLTDESGPIGKMVTIVYSIVVFLRVRSIVVFRLKSIFFSIFFLSSIFMDRLRQRRFFSHDTD